MRRLCLFVAVVALVGCGRSIEDSRLYYSDLSRDNYHPLEARQVDRVFAVTGPLYVKPSVGYQTFASTRPWAGYWYPLADRSLFAGEQAPLAKLQRSLRSLGADVDLVSWEQENYQGDVADGWEGLCAAWASAAVSIEEPREPQSIAGERFSIADQKGILTKLYQRYRSERYGIVYRGSAETDGTYQDLRPEAFHALALHAIRDGNSHLLMDEDPGIEVWIKPVFKVRMKVEPDSVHADVLRVSGSMFYTEQLSELSDELTSAEHTVQQPFAYALKIARDDHRDEGYRVLAGTWLGESFSFHPDTIELVDKRYRQSNNPELNRLIPKVIDLFSFKTL